MSSVSVTKVSPAAPPKTIAPNLCLPVNSFNFLACLIPFCAFLLNTFAYLPVLFAFNALVASLVAIFAPAAAGIPIWIKACVSLPTALCSAISSKGFNLSKSSSTSIAALSDIPNASMSSAPRDTTPSTVLIKPEPTPAAAAVRPPTSSSGTFVVTSTPRTFLVIVFFLPFSLSRSCISPMPSLKAIYPPNHMWKDLVL